METSSSSPSWNPAELTTHTEWIRGLALQLVRDSARADDLVQETLLAALERKPHQGRSLRPWLRRVLQNRFALGRRSEARRQAREEDGATPEALPSSTELVENAEAHALLVQALTKLREPHRTALLLRYFEGKTPQEIARSQGMPTATVRSHLKRGLDELREELDRRHGKSRRAWALALIPFAITAPDAVPPGGPISSLTHSIRAMNPLTQVLIGSSLVLATAALVTQSSDLLPPEGTAIATGDEAEPLRLPRSSAAGIRREAAESSSTGMALSSEDEAIAGVVLDTKSDAPLPNYAFRIRLDDDDEGELIWSDDEGNFESARTYTAGVELTLTMIDHPDLDYVIRTSRQVMIGSNAVSTHRTWDPAQAPIELKALVGPTYSLALTAPPACDTTNLIGLLRLDENQPWGPVKASSQFRGPVREGTSPWLRFGWTGVHLPTDRPWLLRIETPDGLWAGEAQVEAGDGVYPETTAITITPTAKLELGVATEAELVHPTVFLEPSTGGARRIMWGDGRVTLDDGRYEYRFQLGAVPAGAYSVLVSIEGLEQLKANVNLVAGEVLSHQIEVQHGPLLSYVRGELRSESGEYQESITLHLSNRVSGSWTTVMPRWEEQEGKWVAPFAFDNLVAGEYDLIFYALGSYYRWDPLPVSVTPPHEELVLTCHDTDPVRTLKIGVTDTDTGEALASSFSSITLEGCATAQMAIGGRGSSIFEKVPIGVPMEWWSVAEGYVPQWGDESAIGGTEAYKDIEYHVIDVALQPGWGARVEARQLESGDPLEGVEVIIDGEIAGTTDATGCFEVTLEEKPGHIELRRNGWHFVRGSYDADTGELTGVDPTHRVTFGLDG
jgi:RNA polymerase sigma factor (sigma-70 family)